MNKKMSAQGGSALGGNKIKKIKSGVLFIIMFLLVACNVFLAEAQLNPSYGTTTFFSEKNESPSANPPIYDVGVSATNNNSNNNSNSDSKKKDDKLNNTGGLFGSIVSGIGNFFGGSSDQNSTTDSSLFDWQQDSDAFGNSANSIGNGEFVMGARGESLENIDDEEAAKYNSRLASGFNFSEKNSSSAPKKSRLLFTNIIVPVDLTTQYILISFVFVVAIGLSIGYYFWKKETAEAVINPNEEYYD